MPFDFLYGGIASSHIPGALFGNPSGDQDWWTMIQHQTDFSYYHNNKMENGNAGQLLIIPPHYISWHGARVGAKEGFVDDWLYFKSDIAKSLFCELNIPIATPFDVADKQLIRPYIKKISVEHSLGEIGNRLMISSFLYELIANIARQREYCYEKDLKQKLEFDNIRFEMLSEYNKQHTIEELAQKAGYSAGHFAFLYRHYYNTSPIDDLLKYRISLAKLELVKGELSVTEISQKCGFSSIHHFSRFFKKHIGFSPSEYRKKQ